MNVRSRLETAAIIEAPEGFSDAAGPAPESKLPVIDMEPWLHAKPPPREFAFGDLLPLRQAGLLTGLGGVGKGIFAQQLVTCSALALTCLGLRVNPAPAIYLTTEDDTDELWRREEAICAQVGGRIADVIGQLHLTSLVGERHTALATFDANGQLQQTDRWGQIVSTARAVGARLIVLDNATDLMAGDHNDLHQVAEFVQLLTGLAIEQNGAVVIVHHPNKGGDDWLGSIAWHNKVRNRLLLKRPDSDVDPDARVLISQKANYAPAGGPFRWFKGAFVRDEDLSPDVVEEIAATVAANADNEIFLKCLRERTRQARAVSEKHSPTFAPSEFAKMQEAKGLSKARLEAAMDRLFRIAAIKRAELWKGPDRKPVYGLRESAGNGAVNGAGDARATLNTDTAGNGAGDAEETHTRIYDTAGAALGAAAPTDDAGIPF